MSQLWLDGIDPIDLLDHLPHSDAREASTSHDLVDSVNAVINAIPLSWGPAAPQAYLYVRPVLLALADRKRSFEFADALHSPREHARSRRTPSDHWLRLNGEPSPGVGGRDYTRAVSEPVRATGRIWGPGALATWWMSFRCAPGSQGRRLAPSSFRDHVFAAGAQLECIVRPSPITHHGESGLLASSIHQLVLATYWGDDVAAAVALARYHAPLSDDWAVAIDQALASGDPWAERLALLSLRPLRDPIIRALAWMHDGPRPAKLTALDDMRWADDGYD